MLKACKDLRTEAEPRRVNLIVLFTKENNTHEHSKLLIVTVWVEILEANLGRYMQLTGCMAMMAKPWYTQNDNGVNKPG